MNIEEYKTKSRKDIEKEIEKLKVQESKLKNEVEFNNSMQQALKIILNQTYGAFLNKYFVMYEQAIGASITSMGRDQIKYVSDELNKWFHEEWHLDTELHSKIIDGNGIKIKSEVKQLNNLDNIVKYIDTDSCFLSWKTIMDSCNWEGNELDFILCVYENKVKDLNQKLMDDYCAKFGVENLHKFALERINYSVFFLAKKMYIQHVNWEEGDFYEKIKYLYPKGIDLVRKSTPAFVRDKVMGILHYLFNHPDDYSLKEIQKQLKEIKKQFTLVSNIEDISIGCGVNNYHDKVIDDQDKLIVDKGAHWSIRAAAFYNHLLYKNNTYKNKYSPIKNGDRLKMFYVKSDDKTTEKFAFPLGQYPKEFAPPVDFDTQFEKTVLSPINKFMEAMKLKQFDHRLTLNISLF